MLKCINWFESATIEICYVHEYEFIVWIQLNQLMNFMRMCRLCVYCMYVVHEPHARWALSMGIERTKGIVAYHHFCCCCSCVLRYAFWDRHIDCFLRIQKKFMGFIRSAYGSTFPSSTHYVKNVKCAELFRYQLSSLFSVGINHRSTQSVRSKNVFIKQQQKEAMIWRFHSCSPFIHSHKHSWHNEENSYRKI